MPLSPRLSKTPREDSAASRVLTFADVEQLKQRLRKSLDNYRSEQEQLLDEIVNGGSILLEHKVTYSPKSVMQSCCAAQEHIAASAVDETVEGHELCIRKDEGLTNLPESLDEQRKVLKQVHSKHGITNQEVSKSSSRFAQYFERWSFLVEPVSSGNLAAFVRSRAFAIFCLAVIVINIAFTVYSTNYAMDALTISETTTMDFFEICFLAFYSVELFVKMAVFRCYFFCNSDMCWNILDTVLVVLAYLDLLLSTLDTKFMRSLRLLKMSKVARILRVLRFLTELRLMLNCLLGSFMPLFWACLLLFFFNLMFSLVFVQGMVSFLIEESGNLQDDELNRIRHAFGSVQDGILTLFQTTAGGLDWGETYDLVKKAGLSYAAAYLFYIVFFYVAFMNIVASIFLEKTLWLAIPDTEELMLRKRKSDLKCARELAALCRELDVNTSGCVTQSEFHALMGNPKMLDYFEHHGLDVKDADIFFQVIADSKGQHQDVEIHELVDACLKMRGPATSLDLMSMMYEMRINQQGSLRFQSLISKKVDDLASLIGCGSHGRLALLIPEDENLPGETKTLANPLKTKIFLKTKHHLG